MHSGETIAQIRHAVVICTRNRPGEVTHVLDSIAEQDTSRHFMCLIVDASDAGISGRVKQASEPTPDMEIRYVRYPGEPSLARQRNFGVEALPPTVEFVHFLDDDVTLEADYLDVVATILETRPDVGGVGGRVLDSNTGIKPGFWKRAASRLFLLESARPGKVLASGGLTGAQSVSLDRQLQVECLGGCASYRRDLVARLRFDDRLIGYSMDEDLDFSYRLSKVATLLVDPQARLIHHLSPSARHSVRESRRDLLVHRYWFVEKNIEHPLKKLAFWWKILGSYLMTCLSRNPQSAEARRGIIDGITTVRSRQHELLRASDPGSGHSEAP